MLLQMFSQHLTYIFFFIIFLYSLLTEDLLANRRHKLRNNLHSTKG
uniref:Uncharacterized protein n=1 Tax=Anguilla anguilla TaxID=7936 RepID=A0A0E9RE44_ANGAN